MISKVKTKNDCRIDFRLRQYKNEAICISNALKKYHSFNCSRINKQKKSISSKKIKLGEKNGE